MPKSEITQAHTVSTQEARARIDDLARQLSERYGLSSSWTSDTLAEVKGTGASGRITIEPALVRVALDLSFALSPMKGRIESRIKEELHKLFA